MNKFITGLNSLTTTTENGDKAYQSTLSANLDLFYKIGGSRGKDIIPTFLPALAENTELALRIAMYSRDIRGGQGERQLFKNIMTELVEQFKYYGDKGILKRIIAKIPEIGRYDDLMVFWGTEFEDTAVEVWINGLVDPDTQHLAAKWAPRKDKKGAKPLRKAFEFSEKYWRKYLAGICTTTETKMCARQWTEIDYNKVPSLAAARYQTAFSKRDFDRYSKYKEKLAKGEAKVNAGAVYPYDIIKSLGTYGTKNPVADAQWKALPDYIGGSNESFLPIVDVSGSMLSAVSGTTTALDVAISLGIYLSERNKSAFKDHFITFSNWPELVSLGELKTLSDKYRCMSKASWGMSTDIESVYSLVLNNAISNKLTQDQMPTKLLILSDMQFNKCVYTRPTKELYRPAWGSPAIQINCGMAARQANKNCFETWKDKFSKYGYKMPEIVFWNLNDRIGSIPVTKHESGVALVSGFSPSIMKSLLKGDLTPEKVMLDAVMIDRYNIK